MYLYEFTAFEPFRPGERAACCTDRIIEECIEAENSIEAEADILIGQLKHTA